MPKKKPTATEPDGLYLLKLLLFFILGTFWVRLTGLSIGPLEDVSLPIGLVVGLVFAAHEHFQIDRKIEFAVLLVATFISYYLPVGVVI